MKKIVILQGQSRKIGSNYNISWDLAKKIDESHIVEHFVKDIPFCTGCCNCILKGEDVCPHRAWILPIAKDIKEADILIINSPTYVMEMTGQLKNFFDHMAYRYMIHRPHKSMPQKVAVLISTSAGSGHKRVTNSLKNQMLWWGVGKSYSMEFPVRAMNWKNVTQETKEKIEKKSDQIARKIKNLTKVKRGLKGQLYFQIMKRILGKMNNPMDLAHWKENGWL